MHRRNQTTIPPHASKKWVVFIACAIAVFMVDVDLTAVNLVLTNMASELHAPLSTMQWVIDGYMIAAAGLMAFGGRLADTLGSRRVFLSGLLAFALASAAVGFSMDVNQIIIARIIQGACIAFTFSISLVVIRAAFPANKQGFVIGLMVAIAGLSQAIGPTFGATILTYLGWRYIFLINIPLSAIALIMGYLTIPKATANTHKKGSLNGPAVFLFCFSLLLLMTALNEAIHWGLLSLRFIGPIIVSIAALIWFIAIEERASDPILNLRLFKIANFSNLNVSRLGLSYIYFTLLLTVSLLLQNILNYSALNAGLFMLSLTLVIGVLSIPAGKMVDKLGVKKPFLTGLLFLVLGLLTLLLFYTHVSSALLGAALALIGVSFALTMPASGTATMMSVPPEQGGSAMGLYFTTSFIGGSVGIAISSFILQKVSSLKLNQLLSHTSYQLSTWQISHLKNAASGLHSIEKGRFPAEWISTLESTVHTAFLHGFLSVIGVSFIFAIIIWLYSTKLRF
jgi:EmrB/QacA subfamily drug resistance transporter